MAANTLQAGELASLITRRRRTSSNIAVLASQVGRVIGRRQTLDDEDDEDDCSQAPSYG